MKIYFKLIFLLLFIELAGGYRIAGQETNLSSIRISSKADFVLMIDNSSSIKEKEDQELMRQAVQLFIDVLEEGDKLAILTFGEGANLLGREELVEKRTSIKNRIDESNLSFLEKESDITAGFELLEDIGPVFWRNRDRLGQLIPKVLILVTDGRLFVDPKENIPQRYRRLVALRDRFQKEGIEINCLELLTNESKALLHETSLKITGSDLLRQLADGGTNSYQRLVKLVNVIDSYMQIVRLNKATTTFGSLTGPLKINQTVRELRLFILKRDKEFHEVETKKMEIVFGQDFSLNYHPAFESGKELSNGLFVKWNMQNGYDVVVVDPSGLKNHNWKNTPLISVDFTGVHYDHVYHLPSDKDIGHLVWDVPRINLLNHPIHFSVEVYENDPINFPTDNRCLPDSVCEVLARILPFDAPESLASPPFRLPYHREEQAFVFDLHHFRPQIDTGDYKLIFTARLMKMGEEEKYSRSAPFSLWEDYLQPASIELTTGFFKLRHTVPLSIRIDAGSPYYAAEFDPRRPLTMVLARVLYFGQLQKTDTLQFQNQTGSVSFYAGKIQLQDAGDYEVQYVLIGSKDNNRSEVVSKKYPLEIPVCYPCIVVEWLLVLLLAMIIIGLIILLLRLLKPTFSLDMSRQSGKLPSRWRQSYKLRNSRKYEFTLKNGSDIYKFAISAGFGNSRYLKNEGALINRHRRKGKRELIKKIRKGKKEKIRSNDKISFGLKKDPKYVIILKNRT